MTNIGNNYSSDCDVISDVSSDTFLLPSLFESYIFTDMLYFLIHVYSLCVKNRILSQIMLLSFVSLAIETR